MIEPLPPALAALIAAEKNAPGAPAATRAAVKAKLASSLGTAGFGIGKVLAIVALTVGAGTATIVGVHSNRHVDPPVVARAPVTPVEIVTTPSPPPELPAPIVIAKQSPTPTRHEVASEATLLAQAWRALSAKDPARALSLVELDTRSHPAGVLVEERGALHIVALARLGRLAEATRAAKTFELRYPQSIHHTLITSSLGGAP